MNPATTGGSRTPVRPRSEPVDLRARFAAGEHEAIREVMAEFGGPVTTVARSIVGRPELVSDVVQQTFIKAWRASATFDPKRELAPWLYAIARRTAIDVLRREQRPTNSATEPEVELSVPAPSFETTWERYEVRRALDHLAPDERDVVRLSHFVGLPHSAIAAQLDLPLGTVKSRSNRALKKLALALGHL